MRYATTAVYAQLLLVFVVVFSGQRAEAQQYIVDRIAFYLDHDLEIYNADIWVPLDSFEVAQDLETVNALFYAKGTIFKSPSSLDYLEVLYLSSSSALSLTGDRVAASH